MRKQVINFKGAPLARMTPARQVELCGGDIPPFLLRKKVPGAVMPVVSDRVFSNSLVETAFPWEKFTCPPSQQDDDTAALLRIFLEQGGRKRDETSKAERKASRPRSMGSFRREKRAGLVDMKVIAKDLGILPREARGALRSLKWEKPSWGWAFEAKEVDNVKKAITQRLKTENNKKKKPVKKSNNRRAK